jgi:flagellar basal-body rod modification protein FlgD
VSIGATEATTPSTTTAATSGLGATTTTSSAAKDKDMFMQLLVAQMKYQDPTSPADSTQFLTQSAQFSQLEKLEALATQNSQILAGQMAFGATSMVGQTVSYSLADGTSGTGPVDGVIFGSSGPVLQVGGTEVPIADVLSVKNTAASTTTP